MADWKEHIVVDPEILTGKPIVKGTRLAVDFLLSLFAEGWTEERGQLDSAIVLGAARNG